MELTAQDTEALESLNHKQQHITTAIKGLVESLSTALFLSGEGGTGKSYLCESELRRLKAKYVLHNSRMTGRGLVDALEKEPGAIHWIEDAETLLADPKAIGVLRSACWSQSKAKPKVRPISWKAHKVDIRFDFTGSLLVISNAPLVDTSHELRALRTRVKVLKLDFAPAEILALMKKICQAGYRIGSHEMTPTECWTVGNFIREKVATLNRAVDLRLLDQGFNNYILHREHNTDIGWQDMIAARMSETPTRYKSRQERAAEDYAIAIKIHEQKDLKQADKIKLWKEQTGKNKASFYNALKKAG